MKTYLVICKYDRGIRHGVARRLPEGKTYSFLCHDDEMKEERYNRIEGIEVTEVPEDTRNIHEALQWKAAVKRQGEMKLIGRTVFDPPITIKSGDSFKIETIITGEKVKSTMKKTTDKSGLC